MRFPPGYADEAFVPIHTFLRSMGNGNGRILSLRAHALKPKASSVHHITTLITGTSRRARGLSFIENGDDLFALVAKIGFKATYYALHREGGALNVTEIAARSFLLPMMID